MPTSTLGDTTHSLSSSPSLQNTAVHHAGGTSSSTPNSTAASPQSAYSTLTPSRRLGNFSATAASQKTGAYSNAAHRGGLQRSRLLASKVSAPRPINLPSLRRENAGLDPNVSLVPTGIQGWGSPSSAKASPKLAADTGDKAQGQATRNATQDGLQDPAAGHDQLGRDEQSPNSSTTSPPAVNNAKTTTNAWNTPAPVPSRPVEPTKTAWRGVSGDARNDIVNEFPTMTELKGRRDVNEDHSKKEDRTTKSPPKAPTFQMMNFDVSTKQTHWDEMEDDNLDFDAPILELADGTTVKIAAADEEGLTQEGRNAAQAAEDAFTNEPVAPSDRFSEDYDRAYPPQLRPVTSGSGRQVMENRDNRDQHLEYARRDRYPPKLYDHERRDERDSYGRRSSGPRRESMENDRIGYNDGYRRPRGISSGRHEHDSLGYRNRSHDRDAPSWGPDERQRRFEEHRRHVHDHPNDASLDGHLQGNHNYDARDHAPNSSLTLRRGSSEAQRQLIPDKDGLVDLERPPSVTAAQRELMQTAAEKAKKRREEEETEYIAARERARQKALALAQKASEQAAAAPVAEKSAVEDTTSVTEPDSDAKTSTEAPKPIPKAILSKATAPTQTPPNNVRNFTEVVQSEKSMDAGNRSKEAESQPMHILTKENKNKPAASSLLQEEKPTLSRKEDSQPSKESAVIRESPKPEPAKPEHAEPKPTKEASSPTTIKPSQERPSPSPLGVGSALPKAAKGAGSRAPNVKPVKLSDIDKVMSSIRETLKDKGDFEMLSKHKELLQSNVTPKPTPKSKVPSPFANLSSTVTLDKPVDPKKFGAWIEQVDKTKEVASSLQRARGDAGASASSTSSNDTSNSDKLRSPDASQNAAMAKPKPSISLSDAEKRTPPLNSSKAKTKGNTASPRPALKAIRSGNTVFFTKDSSISSPSSKSSEIAANDSVKPNDPASRSDSSRDKFEAARRKVTRADQAKQWRRDVPAQTTAPDEDASEPSEATSKRTTPREMIEGSALREKMAMNDALSTDATVLEYAQLPSDLGDTLVATANMKLSDSSQRSNAEGISKAPGAETFASMQTLNSDDSSGHSRNIYSNSSKGQHSLLESRHPIFPNDVLNIVNRKPSMMKFTVDSELSEGLLGEDLDKPYAPANAKAVGSKSKSRMHGKPATAMAPWGMPSATAGAGSSDTATQQQIKRAWNMDPSGRGHTKPENSLRKIQDDYDASNEVPSHISDLSFDPAEDSMSSVPTEYDTTTSSHPGHLLTNSFIPMPNHYYQGSPYRTISRDQQQQQQVPILMYQVPNDPNRVNAGRTLFYSAPMDVGQPVIWSDGRTMLGYDQKRAYGNWF